MFELSLPTFRKVSMLKRIVRIKKLIHPRPMMMVFIGNLLQSAPLPPFPAGGCLGSRSGELVAQGGGLPRDLLSRLGGASSSSVIWS